MRFRATTLIAIFGVALVMAQSASAAPAGEELSPAAQTLAQCVQTNHRLSVLMLIDESGSLRTTDPEDRRVDGVRAALTGLSELADTPVGGVRPRVSVLMAGFYARVRPDPGVAPVGAGAWKQVGPETIDALNASAGAYARLDQGRATDYGTALLAARQLLKERLIEESQGGVAPPCEALIWFTDGRYALPRRVGKAGVGLPKTVPYAPKVELDQAGAEKRAVAAGRNLMCRPGGLMDNLASSGVTRFTVALSTQLSPRDAAFLDAATTGAAAGQHCGTELSRRTGEYLNAGDSDRLFFAFGGLLSGVAPVHTRPVCVGLSCLEGVTSFTTVPGISEFLIRASSGVEKAVLELKSPDGQSVRLSAEGEKRASLAGVAITNRWVSPTAVEVQGEFPADGTDWVGDWSYSFIDPSAAADRPSSRARSSVQLFADLQPTILGEPALIRGVPTKLTFGLNGSSGSGPQLTAGPLLDAASLTATVDDPVAGGSTPVPIAGPDEDGNFSASITVPKDSSAGFVYLGLTAHLAIPGGTPVAPQYRSYSVPVRFPPGEGYPTLSPSSLHLPSVRGLSSTEGELTVSGSSVAGGCVWVGGPDLQAPEGKRVSAVTEPAARSGDDCLRVGRGQERTLKIRFSPSSAATGDVSGSIPIHLRSNVVAGSRTISVPVTFAVAARPDTTRRDILFALLIVVGALFPLLFLHLLNYLNARFTAPQDLLVLAQDSEASSRGLSADVTPQYTAFKPLTFEGENRKVRALEVDAAKLRAVASGGLTGLFRGPYGLATAAEGGHLAAGSLRGPLRSWPGETRHEVPLSLAGTWLFIPDATTAAEAEMAEPSALWDDPGAARQVADAGQSLSGRLILVIANGGDPEMGEELLASASRTLGSDEVRGRLALREEDGEDEEGDGAGSRIGRIFQRKPAAVTASVPDEDEDHRLGEPAHEDDPWD